MLSALQRRYGAVKTTAWTRIQRLTTGTQYPGAIRGSEYTSKLEFITGSSAVPIATYRLLGADGGLLSASNNKSETDSNKKDKVEIDKGTLTQMYTTMLTLAQMDLLLFEAQRQGRISFYMTHHGEEASLVAPAAALAAHDVFFGQYREAGFMLFRGFSIQQMMHQCQANAFDLGKGRQMPIHYGSKALNIQTISSPLGPQIPQAAGAAYALKREKKDACVVCFFGDGAASEGDFHAGLNIAATMEAPVIFF
ncbi:hypothetical protein HK100_006686, partial [Physocladia obscura]